MQSRRTEVDRFLSTRRARADPPVRSIFLSVPFSKETRYALAGGAVLIALLSNFLSLTSRSSGAIADLHYFALIFGVMVSALLCGFGPAILAAAVLGIVGGMAASFGSSHSFQSLIVFLAEGALIGFAGNLIKNVETKSITIVGLRYAAVGFFVAAAVVLKMTVFPQFEMLAPFAFFYTAVLLGAWIGGTGPGIMSVLLAAGAAKFFFLAPLHSFAIAEQTQGIQLGLFALEGILLVLLSRVHVSNRNMTVEFSIRSQNHRDMIRRSIEDVRALRSISKDTLWEWDLKSAKITRTKGKQDSLAEVLADQEGFTTWIERIHPDDQFKVRETLSDALASGCEECFYCYRLQRKDGVYIDVSDQVHIVRDGAWNPVRVVGRSAELIKKHPGRLVQLNEQRFAHMFEDSPAGMILMDEDLRILTANAAARMMLRTQPFSLSGTELALFAGDNCRAELSDALSSLLKRERLTIHFEHRCVRTTGETFPARLSATLISNFMPESAGCLLIVEDLTESMISRVS